MDNRGLAVVSFFSGAGFLDLGFEQSGFDVLLANEIEPRFANAYTSARENMRIPLPANGLHVGGIEDFLDGAPAKKLGKIVSDCQSKGTPIGFIGGPPCPDFSVGGKNRGRDGERGQLSRTYIDVILKHKPDWFLFENVKGLWRTKRHREFFDELVDALQSVGYSTEARLMNAIESGVAQDRDRVFLIGFKAGFESAYKELDLSTGLPYPGRSAFDFDWPSLSGDPEDPGNKVPRELTVQYWFDRNDVENHANARHGFKPRAGLARFKSVIEGDVSKKSFKRLHRYRYSPTAAYGNNEVHLHPTLPRRITVAEALALQSLPADFVMPSDIPLSAMFKAIGNGVPYVMSLFVAERIKSAIEKGSLSKAA